MKSRKNVKCPRCGKKISIIKGQESICPYCGERINRRVDNLYHSTGMVTPTKENRNKKFLGLKAFKVYTAALALISLVSVMTLFSGTSQNEELNDKLQVLQNDYDILQEDYDSLNNKYQSLSDEHDSLLKDYDELKAEIENYKDQQATIDDLVAKLDELHSQYDTLESERDELQKQVDAKKAEQERIAREEAAQQLAEQQANAGAGTVYWVSGGKVYHTTPNCTTLKRSSNIQSGTISESGKSRACKVCG